MRYDFIDLRLFLSLTRTLNLTASAKELNLSTAALSVRLKKLEEALGVRLFNRLARGVSLTHEAIAIRPHVLKIMAQANLIDTTLDHLKKNQSDHIDIVSNSTGLQNFIAFSLGRFISKHCVDCTVREFTSRDLVNLLLTGEADVGFGLLEYALPYKADLEVLPFINDEHVLIAPTNHPLSILEIVDFETTLSYPHISLMEKNPMSQAMRDRARQIGAEFKPRLMLPDFLMIEEVVKSGAGIAIVPRSSISSTNDLAIVRIADGWASRPLGFFIPKSTRKHQLLSDFIECVREDHEKRCEQ